MPQKRKREVEVSERRLRPRREEPAPPPKRTPAARIAAKKAVKGRAKTPPPGLNPLPAKANERRPPRQLFIWGSGDMGQLGEVATTNDYPKPKIHQWTNEAVKEEKFGGVECVAAGGMHSYMIDESGRIWSWGVNDDAALGRVTSGVKDEKGEPLDADDLQRVPHVIEDLVEEEFRAAAISGGDSVGVALNTHGELRIWGSFKTEEGSKAFSSFKSKGRNTKGRPVSSFKPVSLPVLEKAHFSRVVCGANHVIALTTKGDVYGWGAANQGQVGRKVLERHKLDGMEPERLDLKNIIAVGAGSYHSLAVDNEGSVFAWGLDNYGQLGYEMAHYIEEKNAYTPQYIDSLDPDVLGSKVVSVDGGEHHSLFLTEDGRVFAVGRGTHGELGIPLDHPIFKDPKNLQGLGQCIFTPHEVPIPEPIAKISVSSGNNLALAVSGKLYSWGQGSLGIDEDTDVSYSPVVIAGGNKKWQILDVSVGGQHSIALATQRTEEEIEMWENAKDAAVTQSKPKTNGIPLTNGINGKH